MPSSQLFEELRALTAFSKVVETGSFRAAASALQLSPSLVSSYVAWLERHLGTTLVHRSTRAIAVTPRGTTLYGSSSGSIADMLALLHSTAADADLGAGELRVSLPVGLAFSPFQAALATFALQYPGIKLSVHYSDASADRGFDLVLCIGRPDGSAFKVRRLCALRRRLVASPDYLADREPPNHPRDLAHFDWLYLHPRARFAELRHRTLGVERVWGSERMHLDSVVALQRFACLGMGLAVVPHFLTAEDLEAGRVADVLPGWQPTSSEVFAFWPRSAPRAGLASRLVSHLAQTAEDFEQRVDAMLSESLAARGPTGDAGRRVTS
jgi:DNA-binding transcriptional LysR family regulator